MQRVNSKSSVSSISSRSGEKKEKPSHVIMRRDENNQLLLLPIASLVNATCTRLKVNDMATFKLDQNNRKQERGQILLFGE